MKSPSVSIILKPSLFLLVLFFTSGIHLHSQTLVMNEVSNGPAGNQEYVEFVVYDSAVVYGCTSPTPPCIDIRGWIFDDNSGYHGPGGVAPGCVRFSFDPMWSCVPVGTIITIYNDADPNTSMPANDISMTDGNCLIIAPISNTALFEKNSTTPGAVICSYPAVGWTPGGSWSFTLLANTGDCARVVDLAGCEVFSVSYAGANLNTLIYFASGGSGTDNVWSFTNNTNNSPFLQANWTEGCADPVACGSNQQTPGAPNNAANAAWIGSMNNFCSPITPLNVDSTLTASNCSCTGTASAIASGSIPGYTYNWLPAPGGGQGTANATGLCIGTYTCTVTSSINCTSSVVVTIPSSVVLPAITISNPTPTICVGQNATLTGNGGVSYVWSTGAITPSITVSPVITTTYTVTGTGASGCTNTATTTVTVNIIPVFTAAANSPLCVGSQLDLTAQTIAGATYNWLGPNGFSAINQQNPSIINVTIPASGTYTVTATDAFGCTGTATANVLVNSSPVPVANNNGPLCVGAVLNLSSNGGIDFDWTGPGGFVQANTQNPVVPVVTLTGAGIYTVTVTDGNGCSATATTNVVVNALPLANAANSGPICVGGTINLTSNGGTAYAWNGPAGFSDPINQNPVLNNVATTQNGSYTVTVTDANGCSATASTLVVVNALPIVIANTNSPICIGNNILLSSNGAASYSWLGPAAFSSIAQNPIINNAAPANNGVYTVTGTDAVGCSNSATVNVTIFPSPTALFAGNNLLGCAPVCVNFSDLSTVIGSTITTWSWNIESQIISTNQNVNFCFNNPGLYDAALTVTTSDGCTSTLSLIDYINVIANPVADFIYSPNVIYESDPTVNFTNLSSGATSYIWNFGDGGSSVLTNPSYTYADTGTYCISLEAINSFGCSDTVVHCLDIFPEFTVFIPNSFSPNGDGLNEQFMVYGRGISALEARIFNRWGQEIYVFSDVLKGWPGTTQNGGICQLGVYVYKIKVTNFLGKEFDFIGQVNLLR